MKILYAAGNTFSSKIQLSRFLQAIGSDYKIKIAAYKKSSPKNISIDWTLDCMLNVYDPDFITLDNDNLNTYYNQIKHYNPDLIISDLDFYTSYIANELNIQLWQCSSSIINNSLTKAYKYSLGVYKTYSYIFNKNPVFLQRILNIIDNSNRNLVYSHLGDTTDPPPLKDEFEWVRPYSDVGKLYVPCRHNIIAGLSRNNKKIIDILKKYPDTVMFSDFQDELYDNLLMKDISNEEEYFCNLTNSNLFINEGETSFLSDAFYNGKYSVVLPNIEDTECILNSIISQKQGLSTSIYSNENLNNYMNKSVLINYNSKIKFLHEKVNEL